MAYPLIQIIFATVATYFIATTLAGLVAKMGFPLPPENKRLGCLDGLRGYLALSVLVHHFVIWLQVTRLGGSWFYPSNNFLSQLGAGSVVLFFMITGCVFYPKILLGWRETRWSAVYITRICRIFPLVFVSVMIVTLLIALRTGRSPNIGDTIAWIQWVSTWSEPPLLSYPDSGRTNAFVLWSLWFEWLFYIFVLPACASAMDISRNYMPTWSVPLSLGLGAIALRLLGVHGALLAYLPMFAVGMLAYELQRVEPVVKMARTATASVFVVVLLVNGMTIDKIPTLLVLPAFGCFFICIACGNDLGGALRTKGALVLGECSYGIYLLHGIFLSVFFVDAAKYTSQISVENLPLFLPLIAILVFLVAAMTYLLIERPAIRAGVRLVKRRSGIRLRSSAAEQQIAP